VTECDVAAKSEEFRAKQPGFVSLSFPTIAGSGPNGAIIHYRVSPLHAHLCFVGCERSLAAVVCDLDQPDPLSCADVTVEQMLLIDRCEHSRVERRHCRFALRTECREYVWLVCLAAGVSTSTAQQTSRGLCISARPPHTRSRASPVCCKVTLQLQR
jgi:hypothetical protein